MNKRIEYLNYNSENEKEESDDYDSESEKEESHQKNDDSDNPQRYSPTSAPYCPWQPLVTNNLTSVKGNCIYLAYVAFSL